LGRFITVKEEIGEKGVEAAQRGQKWRSRQMTKEKMNGLQELKKATSSLKLTYLI